MTHYLLVSPLPPPPISTLLPYTTPFRSPGRPSSGTPGDAEASRPLGQSRGDDAHEELTHLAGGQQGHQHGGETAGGGHERARAYSASCPPGPPMPWSA